MRNTVSNPFVLAAAAVVLLMASPSFATTVFLQDYEPPGNLDAPFNLAPDFSGTTVGVVSTTDTITHVSNDGAAGTTASAELFMEHNTSESPTAAGWQWQVRFLPNSGGSSSAENPPFASDGYVGYFLKVDPAVAADIQTAPALESGSTGTATTGDLKTVIKDGQWHLYQWNMDDLTQFDNTWGDVFGSSLGDTTLEAFVSFDSIAIVSPNGGNATVRIDQIGYNNAGPIAVPVISGDFNQDGAVNAADYVAWRKNDGTPDGYDTWRARFGETSPGGGGSSSVPEPAMLLSLAMGGFVVICCYRGRRK